MPHTYSNTGHVPKSTASGRSAPLEPKLSKSKHALASQNGTPYLSKLGFWALLLVQYFIRGNDGLSLDTFHTSTAVWLLQILNIGLQCKWLRRHSVEYTMEYTTYGIPEAVLCYFSTGCQSSENCGTTIWDGAESSVLGSCLA